MKYVYVLMHYYINTEFNFPLVVEDPVYVSENEDLLAEECEKSNHSLMVRGIMHGEERYYVEKVPLI